MREEQLIPFAPILVESTRSIGYTFESALADIIDNSISANSTVIKVEFSSLPTDAYLCVVDNGVGMKEEELRLAMRYGSRSSLESRESTDLGRFGLGDENSVIVAMQGADSCFQKRRDIVCRSLGFGLCYKEIGLDYKRIFGRRNKEIECSSD